MLLIHWGNKAPRYWKTDKLCPDVFEKLFENFSSEFNKLSSHTRHGKLGFLIQEVRPYSRLGGDFYYCTCTQKFIEIDFSLPVYPRKPVALKIGHAFYHTVWEKV